MEENPSALVSFPIFSWAEEDFGSLRGLENLDFFINVLAMFSEQKQPISGSTILAGDKDRLDKMLKGSFTRSLRKITPYPKGNILRTLAKVLPGVVSNPFYYMCSKLP